MSISASSRDLLARRGVGVQLVHRISTFSKLRVLVAYGVSVSPTQPELAWSLSRITFHRVGADGRHRRQLTRSGGLVHELLTGPVICWRTR